MSKISQKLKRMVEEAGISQVMLARLMNIDRTLLNKVLSGVRPPTQEIIDAICEKLSAKPSDLEELQFLMEAERDGEETALRRRAVAELFEKIAEFDQMSENVMTAAERVINLDDKAFEKTICVMDDKFSVSVLIRDILEAEYYSSPSTHVRVCCPFDFEFLFSELFHIGMQKKHELCIEHLVRMESMSATSGRNNVQVMSNLLPFALNNSRTYTAYYLRESGSGDASVYSVYSYYIIINNRVILLSEDFSDAVVPYVPAVAEGIKRRFDSFKEKALRFTSGAMDLAGVLSSQTDFDNNNADGEIFVVPAPGVCSVFSGDEIAAHAHTELPELAAVIGGYIARFDALHRHGMDNTVTYFCAEGLDMFLEEGYSSEFPRKYVGAFTLEERERYLEQYIRRINDGMQCRAVNSELIKMPTVCSMTLSRRNAANFSQYSDRAEGMCAAVITEESVIASLMEFFTYLPQSRYVLTKEETVALLEDRLEKLRARMAQ